MKAISLSTLLLCLVSVNAFAASSPEKFVKEASQAGMAEVELAKLASQKANSEGVRQYAQQLLQDHQQANEKLKTIAAQKNIPVPTELEGSHKRAYERLSKKSGADFDKEYVDAMVKDHKKVIKRFQEEAKDGKDPELKAFAGQTEPHLRAHLDQAQQLEKQLKTDNKPQDKQPPSNVQSPNKQYQ